MPTDPAYPTVGAGSADERLATWTLVEERVEQLFELPSVHVRGATRRYEDQQLRTAVRRATDGEVDREWRFIAATRLTFSPGLPPGTPHALVRPRIAATATRTFKSRLVTRGIEDIERTDAERLRLESGARVRMTGFDGVDTNAGAIGVRAWIGVATQDQEFLVLTGGYPTESLCTGLGLDDIDDLGPAPNAARDEFFELIRTVE